MNEIVAAVNNVIWSPALIALCLGVGLYFSIRSRFLQLRHVREMIRLMFDGKSSDSGVSSFQALTMTLAGRVGTGNIAGVATAITFGGPGAVFWMWMVAFLGSGSAFVESALGQIYKRKEKGEYRGGPAFYIEIGFSNKKVGKIYAIVFAIATVLATGLLLPGVQSNSIASSIKNAFVIDHMYTGILLVVLLGLIIFGGIKAIANVAQYVVPFMAIAYVLLATIILVMNFQRIPEIFGLIVSSAFGAKATFAGIVGAMISIGVKRGVYSNEAGQGTGPHAAAAAEVDHPAQQGLVQAFSVYVDTLFVCTATALMILITQQYNVVGELTDGSFIVQNVDAATEIGSAAFTQMALLSVFGNFGQIFVGIALFFFAFTTILAYYYITETNVAYLNRVFNNKLPVVLFKLLLMFMVALFFNVLAFFELDEQHKSQRLKKAAQDLFFQFQYV